jgi:hypothetical protein
MPNPVKYDEDVVAWAQEQARLLRAGRFDQLDLQHLADEIEDVGKSEQRELANRMAVLLGHLLKWQHQPNGAGRIGRTPSACNARPWPGVWRGPPA